MKPRDYIVVLLIAVLIPVAGVSLAGIGSVAFLGAQTQRGSAAAPPAYTNSLVTNYIDGWKFQDGNSSSLTPTSNLAFFPLTNNNSVLLTNQGGVVNDGCAYFISANSEYLSYGQGNIQMLARTQNLSFSLWVKWIGTTNVATRTIMSKGTNDSTSANFTEYEIRQQTAGTYGLLRGSGSASAAVTLCTTLTNTWMHIAVVYTNGVSWARYTNGVLNTISTSTVNAFDSLGDLRFGVNQATGTQYADMQLGPVNFWSKTLTVAEVFNCYTNELAGLYYPYWIP